MYSACIFDLDGTLANTLYSIASFSNAALGRCGYPPIPDEDYRRIVGDGTDVQLHRMLRRVCGDNGFSERDVAALKGIYSALYGSDPVHLVRGYPGMRETVAALRKSGIRTAVLSNKPDAWAKVIVGSLFPPGSFDFCYGQSPLFARKPSPEGALRIAEGFGLSPREILYIGDTNTDMKTGKSAGMDTAGALWGFRDRAELEENHATYVMESPKEIPPLVLGGKR